MAAITPLKSSVGSHANVTTANPGDVVTSSKGAAFTVPTGKSPKGIHEMPAGDLRVDA